jgi:hypothetical protein
VAFVEGTGLVEEHLPAHAEVAQERVTVGEGEPEVLAAAADGLDALVYQGGGEAGRPAAEPVAAGATAGATSAAISGAGRPSARVALISR